MSYEMLIGLNVLDDQKYQAYRKEMKPILSTYGGGFRCDFKVSEVLLPQEGQCFIINNFFWHLFLFRFLQNYSQKSNQQNSYKIE